MKNSFLGYSRQNHFPFLLKLLMFILLSTIALLNFTGIYLKILLVGMLILCRQIMLYKNTKYGIYIFLAISSVMITLFWYLFERNAFFISSIQAISKLWLLFLTGNVLLLSTSQDELIKNSFKYKVPKNITLIIIISLNSIKYFMDSFEIILKSYKARSNNKNILKKYYNCLIIVAIDSLFLIIECKKAYKIYYDQIIKSLEMKVV